MEHTLCVKKNIRKDANKVALGIIIYTIIMISVIFLGVIGELIIHLVQNPEILNQTDEALEPFFNQMLEKATTSIIGGILGIVFLVLFFRKENIYKRIFIAPKPMSWKKFVKLLCVFLGIQLVANVMISVTETILNSIGYTTLADIEDATGVSNTFSMFLYISIFAPIIEELVFRGFIMRKLEIHGKVFAIVISSILFGFMHENIYQNIFGIFVGFVLSYTAIEYGIKWSILLHIINNCILGELYYKVTSFLPVAISDIILVIFEIVMFIGAIYVIIKNKDKIKRYIEDNKITENKLKYALTSVWIILYLTYCIISSFQGIAKI